MSDRAAAKQFDQLIVPWLNAAFNLARWVTGDPHDAEDVVQEACLKAFRAIDTIQPGSDGRAWLLTIVRNTGWNWLRRNRGHESLSDTVEHGWDLVETGRDPEAELIHQTDVDTLRRALEELPVEYREVIVLRELEAMSYREIAEVIQAPMGTVMSRLSRGRKALQARFREKAMEAP